MSYTAAVTQGENIVQTNHLVFVFLMYVFEKGKDSVESEKRRRKNQSGSSQCGLYSLFSFLPRDRCDNWDSIYGIP
jgi:hypothetical protein